MSRLNVPLRKDNPVQVLREVGESHFKETITEAFQEPVFISLNSPMEIQIVFASLVLPAMQALVMIYLGCLKFSSSPYFIVSQSSSRLSDILQSLL